ncbi:unnamed protein product [Moneuplotes crassus]|uniref:Fatty acid desaturase domain-containing protein n=1 Tax=Euplotes crassus TaxID=5936 RepID=A0AAD1XER7_EUPCR|nr:unnamed protein product [Moneuplotes crassus]
MEKIDIVSKKKETLNKRSSISSDCSAETDSSEKTNPNVKNKASWGEIFMFTHVLIYVGIVYASYYYMNKNIHIILWMFYVAVPFIDMVFPQDTKNLTSAVSKEYEKDKRFLIPLYAFAFISTFTYIWGIYVFSTDEFSGILHRIMFLFSLSHFGALGEVVGHELLHRRETVHKIFGTLEYTKVLYSHFFIEHVKGHHKNVATPLDPASSSIGESLYEFLPKTVMGSYRSVWKYETKRLKKETNILIWFFKNRLVLFNIGHAAIVLVVTYYFGFLGLFFVLGYAFFGIFMLEAINYVEHYGLRRDKDENGIYEPVNIKHSWNAPQRYTNYLLFKLQRHSDHHANSYKPYQILDSFADSPSLIGGYTLAIITSYVPYVWFKVYSPLAKAAQEEKKIDQTDCEKASFRYYVIYSVLLTLFTIFFQF